MILISCGPLKYDFSNDSEEKGYIRFVTDKKKLPANYSTPLCKFTYYNRLEEKLEIGFFAGEDGTIVTLPPGTHSFHIQPYETGTGKTVGVTAVKDKIVTINCYTIERSRNYTVQEKHNKKIATTTIQYKFGCRTGSYTPYP